VNALANDKVADYINENFVATFMKVGTFRIVNRQKVGGNVASYFCLADGSVIHALPGQVGADTLLSEARWASDTGKYAFTRSTNFVTGEVDVPKLRALVRKAHEERFAQLRNPEAKIRPGPNSVRLPKYLPKNLSTLAQAHWYLAANPLAPIDRVFPYMWEEILNERLSGLPVAKR
jgi:hypothetical protein